MGGENKDVRLSGSSLASSHPTAAVDVSLLLTLSASARLKTLSSPRARLHDAGQRRGPRKRHPYLVDQQAWHLQRQLDRQLDLLSAERRGSAQYQGVLPDARKPSQDQTPTVAFSHPQEKYRRGKISLTFRTLICSVEKK